MSPNMSEPKDDDKLPEPEADDRFKRLVGNLANTPHKPHKANEGRESKAGAKRS